MDYVQRLEFGLLCKGRVGIIQQVVNPVTPRPPQAKSAADNSAFLCSTFAYKRSRFFQILD